MVVVVVVEEMVVGSESCCCCDVMRCKESHPSGWDRCLLCILHDDVHICICSGLFWRNERGVCLGLGRLV